MSSRHYSLGSKYWQSLIAFDRRDNAGLFRMPFLSVHDTEILYHKTFFSLSFPNLKKESQCIRPPVLFKKVETIIYSTGTTELYIASLPIYKSLFE